MFAGPPTFSEDDLRHAEGEAGSTIKQFLITSVILYLSPFAIDAVWKVL